MVATNSAATSSGVLPFVETMAISFFMTRAVAIVYDTARLTAPDGTDGGSARRI